jgi:hypothetical protein
MQFLSLSACLNSQIMLIQKSLPMFLKSCYSVLSFKRTFNFSEALIIVDCRGGSKRSSRTIIVLVERTLRANLGFIVIVCAHIALRLALIILAYVCGVVIGVTASSTSEASSPAWWTTPVLKTMMGSVGACTGGGSAPPRACTFETTAIRMMSIHLCFSDIQRCSDFWKHGALVG